MAGKTEVLKLEPLKKWQITQVRSVIGTKRNQRETLQTLGLRKINSSVVREATPQVRGAVKTVEHLVRVEEVS